MSYKHSLIICCGDMNLCWKITGLSAQCSHTLQSRQTTLMASLRKVMLYISKQDEKSIA